MCSLADRSVRPAIERCHMTTFAAASQPQQCAADALPMHLPMSIFAGKIAFMALFTLLRRTAVTLLAYAVALQVGLSALAELPQSAGAPDFGIICKRPADSAPGHPDHSAGGACCLAAGCAPACNLARQDAVAAPRAVAEVVVHDVNNMAAPPAWPSERPRSSRAPPHVMS